MAMTAQERAELEALIADMRRVVGNRVVRPDRCCRTGCFLCPTGGPMGQLVALYEAELAELGEAAPAGS
jgi:hypothetical protein